MGLERILLQRIRPAVRQHSRLELICRIARTTAARTTCRGCSTRFARHRRRSGAPPRLSSASTTTRRAASSPTTRRPRCSCCATVRPALSGIPPTWTSPGSTTRSSSFPRLTRLGRGLLSRYADGGHRVQLGRRVPHQRRHDASRHSGHLRPRRIGSGDSLDDPRSGDAHLQGDSDLRNYDGNLSTFGDVHVRALAPDPDTLSAFAAERSGTGRSTVMVVHKRISGNTPLTLSLAGFSARRDSVQVWQLTLGQHDRTPGRSAGLLQRDLDVGAAAERDSLRGACLVRRPTSSRSRRVARSTRAEPAGPTGRAGSPFREQSHVLARRACGIPATAIGVSINLTVTSPSSAGSLTLSPDGSSVLPPTKLGQLSGRTDTGEQFGPLAWEPPAASRFTPRFRREARTSSST